MPAYEMDPESKARGTEASPVTGEFDVEPFRQAFLRTGMSKGDLAKELGWWRPDTERVGRALGFHRNHLGRRQTKIQGRTAQRLMEVLRSRGIDPVDVDF